MTLPLVIILCGVLAGLLPAETAAAAQKEKEKEKRSKYAFLLFGTVFTEQGFALPGAEIEVRRAGERKVRWRARSDRRGEFAVRVPAGAEYELRIAVRGYEEQTRSVDARSGNREDLSFRMRPAREGEPK